MSKCMAIDCTNLNICKLIGNSSQKKVKKGRKKEKERGKKENKCYETITRCGCSFSSLRRLVHYTPEDLFGTLITSWSKSIHGKNSIYRGTSKFMILKF